MGTFAMGTLFESSGRMKKQKLPTPKPTTIHAIATTTLTGVRGGFDDKWESAFDDKWESAFDDKWESAAPVQPKP
jgi:hypothetical protein